MQTLASKLRAELEEARQQRQNQARAPMKVKSEKSEVKPMLPAIKAVVLARRELLLGKGNEKAQLIITWHCRSVAFKYLSKLDSSCK